MTNTARTSKPTILALVALIALLLALVGGTAAVADDSAEPGDDPTCAPDDADESDVSSASTDDCDEQDEDEDGDEEFTDVAKNYPHVEGIAWLQDSGVTKGCKTGRFCPNKPVTRGEFATLAARMLGEVDDVDAVAAPADEVAELMEQVAELEARVEALESQ